MIVTSMQLTISSRRGIAVLQKESLALEGEEDVNSFDVRIRACAAVRDEAVDAGRQHRDGHRAEFQHRVVEGANIEFCTERLLRLGPSLENGVLAEIVGQRLRRPRNVSVNLSLNLMFRKRGVLAEVADGSVAAPALRMNSGIDHETGGAPDLIVEHSEAIIFVFVHPHL